MGDHVTRSVLQLAVGSGPAHQALDDIENVPMHPGAVMDVGPHKYAESDPRARPNSNGGNNDRPATVKTSATRCEQLLEGRAANHRSPIGCVFSPHRYRLTELEEC
jgi:hypothetical protein